LSIGAILLSFCFIIEPINVLLADTLKQNKTKPKTNKQKQRNKKQTKTNKQGVPLPAEKDIESLLEV